MNRLVEALKGRFVVVDLGALGACDLRLGALLDAVTLIEVDATGQSGTEDARYHRRIVVAKAIGPQAGRRRFWVRSYGACSSFLQPKNELVRAYGLEEHFRTVEAVDLDCITIADLLAETKVARVDFLKTDLEGLDCAVLRSAGEIVSQTLVVQSELRFQPLYEDEPPLHVAAEMMAGFGFDLVHLRPEVWRYRTSQRDFSQDGRLVWADALFVLAPSQVRDRFGADAGLAFVKQIVLTRALGLSNLAAHILESTVSDIDPELRDPVRAYLGSFQGRGASVLKVADWIGRVLPMGRLWPRLRYYAAGADRILAQLESSSSSALYRHVGKL